MYLYHYDHCPYCVRVRMVLGLTGTSCIECVLPSDDEATPIAMVGKKILPILKTDDDSYLPESLDIIAFVADMKGAKEFLSKSDSDIIDWCKGDIAALVRYLSWPRWMLASIEEFETDSAKAYFRTKKEAVIGNFDAHLADTVALIAKAEAELMRLEEMLPEHMEPVSIDDIYLFPTLRCLSVVKGLIFPPRVDAYMINMAERSAVPLFNAQAV